MNPDIPDVTTMDFADAPVDWLVVIPAAAIVLLAIAGLAALIRCVLRGADEGPGP